MLNLTDRQISYLIISPEDTNKEVLENKVKCEKICTLLWAKDYTIFPIQSYLGGVYEKSFVAIQANSNDSLRKDSIYLMEKFDQDSIIIKYSGEVEIKKILNNGSEKVLEVSIYDSNLENKCYLYNGVSFSFTEKKTYKNITSKEQLRKGMIVEFFNNDRWCQKTITDIDSEWDKMLKLLTKYNKLRVSTD